MKFVMGLMFLLFSHVSFAQGQTKVDIVTRLGPTTAQYQFLTQFVDNLNKEQSKYEYRIAVVPGAEGETAFNRFLSITNEEKRDAILYSSQVTIADPRHNRIASFDYVTTLSMSVAALMVNKEVASNIEEFLEHVRRKEVVYYAGTISSNTGKILNQIFMKKYGIENKVRTINYANPQDILRAMIGKEADYTIFNPESVNDNLNLLMISNTQTAKAYPGVKTGKELQFDEFSYNAFSVFSVPKNNKKLYEGVRESFIKTCNSDSVQKLIDLRKYIGICLTHDEILGELIKERDMLIRSELRK